MYNTHGAFLFGMSHNIWSKSYINNHRYNYYVELILIFVFNRTLYWLEQDRAARFITKMGMDGQNPMIHVKAVSNIKDIRGMELDHHGKQVIILQWDSYGESNIVLYCLDLTLILNYHINCLIAIFHLCFPVLVIQ